MRKITKSTLKKWNACTDGYKWFVSKFPQGASLSDSSLAAIDDGHPDWSDWLWAHCKQDDNYSEQTIIIAGDGGTATAGDGGTATAGDGGCICIEFYDKKINNFRKRTAEIFEGGDGLKPNVKYRLDEDGNFLEVQ